MAPTVGIFVYTTNEVYRANPSIINPALDLIASDSCHVHCGRRHALHTSPPGRRAGLRKLRSRRSPSRHPQRFMHPILGGTCGAPVVSAHFRFVSVMLAAMVCAAYRSRSAL